MTNKLPQTLFIYFMLWSMEKGSSDVHAGKTMDRVRRDQGNYTEEV